MSIKFFENQIFHSRSVYVYSLQNSLLRGNFLELTDGSIWKVEELGNESKAFYASKEDQIKIIFIEDVVKEWQEGERLIFHKVFDHESLLVYNLDRDLLVDVSPFLPPLDGNGLVIAKIDRENYEITLNDDSKWKFDHLCPCKKWKEGNPILIAKDTPWWSNNTHILINLIPCECDATLAHIHPNRLGVRQASSL